MCSGDIAVRCSSLSHRKQGDNHGIRIIRITLASETVLFGAVSEACHYPCQEGFGCKNRRLAAHPQRAAALTEGPKSESHGTTTPKRHQEREV